MVKSSLVFPCSAVLTILFANGFAHAEDSAAPKRPAPAVVVSFEGGVVGESLAKVLNMALDANATIATQPYKITTSKESGCSILQKLEFPPPCQPMEQVLDRLNPGNLPSKGALKPNDVIAVPQLKPYQSGRIFSKSLQSDITRTKNILTNWANLNVTREDRTKNTYDVKYNAFELFIPTKDDAASRVLAAKLFPLRSTNVLVDIVKEAPTQVDLHSTPIAGSEYKDLCATTAAIARTVDYGDYSESHDLDALQVLKLQLPPASATVKVSVHVIDVPVLPAPNLYPAYGDAQPPVRTDCKWGTFVTALHHATHLAGIIFSSGFGFQGLASNVDLREPFTWAIADTKNAQPDGKFKAISASGSRGIELGETIKDRANQFTQDKPRGVFLAATTFDDYENDEIDQLRRGNADVRFWRSPENSIKNRRPMLVVSAGQADPEDQHPDDRQSRPLTRTTPLSPQNLGDLPNVIVVTACDICTRAGTRLLPIANYGIGDHNYVHVAAPGGRDIPGWIDADHIGSAAGTSQAAAYVTGLVAAMISNYPRKFVEAADIKQRVQVTSWPFVIQADGTSNSDATKVAAGLVDPILALLDPAKHWLKENGIWKEVKIKAWSAGSVTFRDRRTGDEFPVKLKDMRRVAQVSAKTGNIPAQVAVYYDRSHESEREDMSGEIRRIGPVVSTFGSTKATVLFCDGTAEKNLDAIEDLIVSVSGSTGNECAR
jgi:subtilisin family serine protease